MSETQIVHRKTVYEKLSDMIRDNISDLMSDEDLQKIIERGIDELLFQVRKDPSSRSMYDEKKLPPLIHELIIECLDSRIRAAIEVWIGNNADKVEKIVSDVLAEGAGVSMVRGMNSMLYHEFRDFRMQIEDKFRKLGVDTY